MLAPESLQLSIFAYRDYRKFLRDYYEQARLRDRKISQRFLAGKLGISSSGWFSDILKGRANLAGTHLVRLAELLKLKPREADYLDCLVGYAQSGSIEERNRHFRKLHSFKEIEADVVGQDKFKYYSQWYYSAIRELLFLTEFRGDFAALARQLDPPIKTSEAREAIQLLEALGFACKDAQGVWRPLATTLRKDSSFKSLYVANFLKTSMDLGMQALERIPKEERHISAMTLSFSAPGFKEAVAEVEALRRKLIALMEEDAHPDKVFQLNVQFFPVTRQDGGRYTLKVTTTTPEYTSLVTSIRIAVGKDDTLPDTLRVPYTGIPVVTGLRAVHDTAQGIVHLSWDPVAYRDFQEYLVYRDRDTVLVPSASAVGKSTLAAYADTLIGKAGIFGKGDTANVRLEYRVKVKNKSDQVGLSYGHLKVSADPPSVAATRVDTFALLGFHWNIDRKADSVSVFAGFQNPRRGLKSARWSVGSRDSGIVIRPLGGARSAKDTLSFWWSREGSFLVYLSVEDEAGAIVRDTLRIPGNSAPVFKPGTAFPDTLRANQEASWSPGALDPDGDNLTYSSSGLPAWARIAAESGIFTGTPKNAHAGVQQGLILRVSDGRRTVAYPAPDFRVLPSALEPKTPVPTASQGSRAVSLGGKIYLLGRFPGASDPTYVFDPSKDAWSPGVPLPANLVDFSVHAVGGRIYLLGGTLLSATGAFLNISNAVWSLDTATLTWSPRAPMPTARSRAISSVAGGKIYMIAGSVSDTSWFSRAIEAYDPAANTWARKKPTPFNLDMTTENLSRGSAVTVDGKIYTMGWDGGGGNFMSMAIAMVYDPQAETWTDLPSLPQGPRSLLAACAAGGKIYAGGGYASGTILPYVEEYDPAANRWTIKSNLGIGRVDLTCAESGGKIYFIHGDRGGEGNSDAIEEYNPALDP